MSDTKMFKIGDNNFLPIRLVRSGSEPPLDEFEIAVMWLSQQIKDKDAELDIVKAANAALIKESMGIMQTKNVIKLKTIADALETLDNNKLSGGGIMTERDYGYNHALMDLADYAQEIE